MALYKNNSNIAQISLYGGGGTSAALPGVINTSYGANTPVIPTTPTPTPVTFTPYSFQAGSLVGGANQVNPALLYSQNTLVKPPITSMGANVMIAGSGNYGGGTGGGGVTDEGVVLGNPNVNNSTFNNITDSPSPTYAQFSGEVNVGNDNKVDLSYGGNAGSGTGAGTVTPPVETPPTETETPPVETPPTDTSGSEGGGTSTPTDTTIDSYYDYLKTEMPEHLKGIYNDTIAAIDQANAKTIAEINAAKERGIVDANTSYQHNLSTYGAKNEALRGMGLAGSGYSEYLDSQAYATQRAEVQGVKAGALAAENEANATADAKKLEAKTALDESLLYYDNLAEQHLEGKWSDILTGAGNGTYSKEQVENLAKYYGFSDEQIATLTGAVDSYETEKAEAEANAIGEKFLAALGDVKQGIYDEEDIPALVSQFNFSPEQEAQLIKEAQEFKKNTYEANTNTASGNVTPDTTDDEIQDMVDQDLIDGKGAEELKDDRRQAQINEINDYIEIGDYDTALKLADKYYNNGNGTIDQDTYQKAYFDFWANGISSRGSATVADIKQDIADIDNQQKAGKLSSADANALKQYIYACAGGKLSSTSYTAQIDGKLSKGTGRYTYTLTIKMDGKEYKMVVKKTANAFGAGAIKPEVADTDTANILTGIAGGGTPTKNTLIMYQGQLWLYSGGWMKIKDTDGLYDKYNTLCGYQAKPTKPTHSTDTTSTSSSSSGSTGGGGGGGRTAGGYNGSGMSVRVHQIQ